MGWGDPLGYLNASGVDEQVADAVLEKAEQMRIERFNEAMQAIAGAVQTGIVRALGG